MAVVQLKRRILYGPLVIADCRSLLPQNPPPRSLHPIVTNGKALGSKLTKLKIDHSLISSFFPLSLLSSYLLPKLMLPVFPQTVADQRTMEEAELNVMF